MNRIFFIAIFASWSLLPILGYSQTPTHSTPKKKVISGKGNVSKSDTTIFTVKEVAASIMPFNVLGMMMTDEIGDSISFDSHLYNWFENATVEGVTCPKGTSFQVSESGNFVIGADSKLIFKFKVDGKIYPIGVGPESKFAVKKKAEGKYILFPERTAILSPPPALE